MMTDYGVHFIVVNKKTNEVCVFTGYRDDVLYRDSVGEDCSLVAWFGCTDSHGVYYHVESHIPNGVPELQKCYNSGILSPDIIGLEKIMELKDDDNPILIYYEFKE